MNALAWNCRGLGNSSTVQELCDFVKTHNPNFMFWSDTRMHADRVRKLNVRLGLRNCLAVSSVGLSGGLALFWDESVYVSLLGQGIRYIDVLTKEEPNPVPWRATFVYGEPRVENRKDIWDLLRRLQTTWQGPWMMMGDFNDAMWQYEHFSETLRLENQMFDFREILSHCDLHDLGFSGLPRTYNNNQAGRRNVRVRLDRAVATPDWSSLFPDAKISHINSACSDHKLLVMSLLNRGAKDIPATAFRYEIMWEREEELGVIIKKAWSNRNPGSDLRKIAENLKNVTADLRSWSRETFGNVSKQINMLQKSYREKIQKTKKEMEELLRREEMMWLQRSRIAWLKEGDRNNKYFHRKAMWRAKKNRIKKLKRDDGTWCTSQEEMKSMTMEYFEKLFTKDADIVPNEVVNLFEAKVTEEMNRDLCKPYSDEEIGDALFQIGPLKAPGPDGFPARFFQRN
ncbi:hypothetical protein BS78_07G118600, partial [Paspalum vaginatum]